MFLLCLVLAPTAVASPRALAREEALPEGETEFEAGAAKRGAGYGAETLVDGSPTSSALLAPAGGRVVLGRGGGSTWLSLVGFTRETLDARREIGGLVLVGLPLDRFARAGAPAAMPRPTLVRAGSGLGAGSPAEPFELTLTPRLARDCVGAAWRAAGLGVDDARLDGVVARARWSAVLPEARLRAVRFEDARLSLDTGMDTSRLRDSAGANVGFEARLTWRFDRLIYADDEPSFERIRLEHRDARARVAAKVLEALFHWQRAALDLRTLPPAQQGTRDEADVVLRVMEAEAVLDVMTSGWFSTHKKSALRSATAPPPRRGASDPSDL